MEDSWAYDNGKIIQQFYDKELLEANDLSPGNFNGDGNGFKLGHDGGPHVLNNVVVWENAVQGIDVNGNGFGVEASNATVYNSGGDRFARTSSPVLVIVSRWHNISSRRFCRFSAGRVVRFDITLATDCHPYLELQYHCRRRARTEAPFPSCVREINCV
ncbi:hypothetical protein OAS39_13750 [Pirellulales bacterium]|nr:hypothetical protein [Pirellulales bacterium]